MLPQGEAEVASRGHLHGHGAMVDEHILRVIRSAESSPTPYTDATQVSRGRQTVPRGVLSRTTARV